jgi:hypothetical protein
MGSIGDLFKNPAIVAGLAAPFVAAAANQADKALDRMREDRERSKGFKAMLDMHPELRGYRSPELVSNVFSSLARANPYVASDPFVAGAMVKNVVAGHEHVTPQEATKMFLGEFDRAVQHRGSMGRSGGGGEGPIGAVTGKAMGALTTGLQGFHAEQGQLAKAEQRHEAYRGEVRDREKARLVKEQITGLGEAAGRHDRAARHFSSLTGIDAPDAGGGGHVPDEVRQWLHDAADASLQRGNKRTGPPRY